MDFEHKEENIGKILARICNSCSPCVYARNKPDTTFGKIMRWHGSWCPAWNAWEKVYGENAEAEKGKQD